MLQGEKCPISKIGEMRGTDHMKEMLYIMGKGDELHAFYDHEITAVSDLWNQRYGHVKKKCVKNMIIKGAVKAMHDSKERNENEYEHCMIGKVSLLNLKSRVKKETKPVEIM